MKKFLLIFSLLIAFVFNNRVYSGICCLCSGCDKEEAYSSLENKSKNNREDKFFKEILAKAYKNKTDLSVWVDELIQLKKKNSDKDLQKAINRLIPFELNDREEFLDDMFDYLAKKCLKNPKDEFFTSIKRESKSFREIYGDNNFLFWIVASDNIEALKCLFDLGLDLNGNFYGLYDSRGNNYSINYLRITIIFECDKIFNWLLENNNKLNNLEKAETFYTAAHFLKNDKAKILINKWFNLKEQFFLNGHLFLHFASRANNIELVKILLEKGADSKVKDLNGNDSLNSAIDGGAFDVVSYFLSLDDFKNENKKEILFKTFVSFVREAFDFDGTLYNENYKKILHNIKKYNFDLKELIKFIGKNYPYDNEFKGMIDRLRAIQKDKDDIVKDSKKYFAEDVPYEQRISEHLQYVWNKIFANYFIQFPEGEISVKFTINKKGFLDDVSLIESSGNGALDKIVIDIIKFSEPFPPFTDEILTDTYTTFRIINVHNDEEDNA